MFGAFQFSKAKMVGGGREKFGKAKLKENKKKMKGKPHARYHGSSITRSFISLPPPPLHMVYTQRRTDSLRRPREHHHTALANATVLLVYYLYFGFFFFFFIFRIVFVFPSFISNLKAIEARECVGGRGVLRLLNRQSEPLYISAL